MGHNHVCDGKRIGHMGDTVSCTTIHTERKAITPRCARRLHRNRPPPISASTNKSSQLRSIFPVRVVCTALLAVRSFYASFFQFSSVDCIHCALNARGTECLATFLLTITIDSSKRQSDEPAYFQRSQYLIFHQRTSMPMAYDMPCTHSITYVKPNESI